MLRGGGEVETKGVSDPDPGSRREEKLKSELWQVHLYRLSSESLVFFSTSAPISSRQRLESDGSCSHGNKNRKLLQTSLQVANVVFEQS